MALLAILLGLAAPVAAVLATRARGDRGMVFVLATIGLAGLGFGLLALMFHGYIEDAGQAPADTIDKALAGFAVSAVFSAAAGYFALRDP